MIDDLFCSAIIWDEFISTKETDIKSKSKIYPNPANNIINIEVNNLNNKQLRCEIFNLQGKLLNIFDNINSNKFEINTSNYPKGNYIYRISDKTSIVKIGKFIIE